MAKPWETAICVSECCEKTVVRFAGLCATCDRDQHATCFHAMVSVQYSNFLFIYFFLINFLSCVSSFGINYFRVTQVLGSQPSVGAAIQCCWFETWKHHLGRTESGNVLAFLLAQ